jgi:hypothetical protein
MKKKNAAPVLDGHPGRDIAGLQQTEQHGAGDQHEGDRQHQQDELGAVDDARNKRRRAGVLGLFVGAMSPVSPLVEPGPQLREPLAIVTSELWRQPEDVSRWSCEALAVQDADAL